MALTFWCPNTLICLSLRPDSQNLSHGGLFPMNQKVGGRKNHWDFQPPLPSPPIHGTTHRASVLDQLNLYWYLTSQSSNWKQQVLNETEFMIDNLTDIATFASPFHKKMRPRIFVVVVVEGSWFELLCCLFDVGVASLVVASSAPSPKIAESLITELLFYDDFFHHFFHMILRRSNARATPNTRTWNFGTNADWTEWLLRLIKSGFTLE